MLASNGNMWTLCLQRMDLPIIIYVQVAGSAHAPTSPHLQSRTCLLCRPACEHSVCQRAWIFQSSCACNCGQLRPSPTPRCFFKAACACHAKAQRVSTAWKRTAHPIIIHSQSGRDLRRPPTPFLFKAAHACLKWQHVDVLRATKDGSSHVYKWQGRRMRQPPCFWGWLRPAKCPSSLML